jgi:putative FmdB family regulatory protein
MPTYDYVCRNCDHELEAFQSITARPKRKCPACGRSSLERRIGTGAAILFKGSGFYQTDYRSQSYAQGQKAESSADQKSEGGEKKDTPAASKPDKASQRGSSASADKSESTSD